jgi:hypothetical protein
MLDEQRSELREEARFKRLKTFNFWLSGQSIFCACAFICGLNLWHVRRRVEE